MAYFLALLDTTVGQTALEAFARKTGWTVSAMRAELLVNAPLARYFADVCRKALDDLTAEAA